MTTRSHPPGAEVDMAFALTDLALVMRGAAQRCDDLAARYFPPGAAKSICDRLERAAVAWPDGERPSNERLAAVLAALHDSAASSRLAAHRCDRAGAALSALAGAPEIGISTHGPRRAGQSRSAVGRR